MFFFGGGVGDIIRNLELLFIVQLKFYWWLFFFLGHFYTCVSLTSLGTLFLPLPIKTEWLDDVTAEVEVSILLWRPNIKLLPIDYLYMDYFFDINLKRKWDRKRKKERKRIWSLSAKVVSNFLERNQLEIVNKIGTSIFLF